MAVAALLAGCPPTNLLKATIAYGTASDDVTSELADTANLMTSICHERAEIEYLSSQFEQLGQPTSFAAFYEHQTHELPDLGTLATWKDQCTAYRALDQRFSKLVHVVGAYGTALAAFAADDADAGTPLGAVIKSIGTDVATALPAAAPYKAELSGAGDPIGRVATALQQRWKAKHLGALVTTLAPDVDTILSALAGYIEAVRTREIGDARGALGDLMEQLHSVNSVGSAAPPGTLSSPPPSPAIPGPPEPRREARTPACPRAADECGLLGGRDRGAARDASATSREDFSIAS